LVIRVAGGCFLNRLAVFSHLVNIERRLRGYWRFSGLTGRCGLARRFRLQNGRGNVLFLPGKFDIARINFHLYKPDWRSGPEWPFQYYCI